MAFRIRAGKLAEEAKSISGASHERAKHAGGYLGMDVFTEYGMDMTRCNLEDPMHMVANNVKHVFHLIMNNGDEEFTRKRRQCEVSRGRFPSLAPIGEGYLYRDFVSSNEVSTV